MAAFLWIVTSSFFLIYLAVVFLRIATMLLLTKGMALMAAAKNFRLYCNYALAVERTSLVALVRDVNSQRSRQMSAIFVLTVLPTVLSPKISVLIILLRSFMEFF